MMSKELTFDEMWESMKEESEEIRAFLEEVEAEALILNEREKAKGRS